MIRSTQRAARAAALSLVAASAHAAPNLFEAHAAITDLKFEVIDLRPDDGVAAAFLPGKNVIGGTAQWSTDVYAGSGWPWPVLELADSGSEVTKVSTRQSIKDAVGGPDFAFRLPDNQARFGRSAGEYTASLAIQGSSLLESGSYLPNGDFSSVMSITTQSWVLKAGTEVRISGVFDLHMHNDVSQLTGDLGGFEDSPFGPWQQALASANMSLSVVGGASGVIVGPSGASSLLDTGVLLLTDQIGNGRSDDFVLIARNTGDTDVLINSTFGMGSRLTVAGAVPEPSSVALLFVGMSFMAWYVRRRKSDQSIH